jgi:molybdenum cofactor cytidylyltransferase
MTVLLCDRFGIGAHELVSIVGAGGKTTILIELGRELASRGGRVILTTTTKIATDQVVEPTCWSADPTDVEAALLPGTPLMVVTGHVQGKVIGPEPDAVDRMYSATSADHVLVEADGARSRSIKAPADHEPAIAGLSSTVIVVVGIDAIGRPLHTVAHRPDRIAALIGLGNDDIVSVEDTATILLHPAGGLKRIPETARVVMAITKVNQENKTAANTLATILDAHPRVDSAITIAANRKP